MPTPSQTIVGKFSETTKQSQVTQLPGLVSITEKQKNRNKIGPIFIENQKAHFQVHINTR